jgi:nitrogen fixation protein FixH
MSGRLWPIALAGVLALTVLANIAMWVVAADPNGSAVEPDYYRKALAWDRVEEQEAVNRSLGWRVQARFLPGHGGAAGLPAALRVTVSDAAGFPLDGARVRVTAIHNALAGQPLLLALAPRGGGAYEQAAAFPRTGLWELRITIERGGRRFTADQRIDTGGRP